jgi:putative ABC transport system ATP-binding protein
MTFIQTTALTKHYQMGSVTVKALDGVDLDLPEGSLTVVMGPSGSGKSTLLHLLGGLDRPTSGEMGVNGYHLNDLDENDLAIYRRETVGFVFQAFNLIQTFTALENVSFPMRFMNLSPRIRKERGMHFLEQVGMADRAQHKPTELSGGQQQRVAIARALVNEPTIIMADEPTGNLDTASGLAIMEILAELNSSGRTVLVVTHDPRMRPFASGVVYLLDGRQVDEPVYELSLL